MSKRKLFAVPTFYSVILYISGLLLFLEWLYPVEQITNTTDLQIFIMYTIFCFLISIVRLRVVTSFLLKGTSLLLILNKLYFTEMFLSKSWLHSLYTEFAFNVSLLFTQSFVELTPLFRSFLFLLLIWLMSYLVYYWFVERKQILLFILLTFIFIALLDTFTAYHANIPIIRTFIISLFALGLNHFLKEITIESLPTTTFNKTPLWMLPLIGSILLFASLGYAMPKFNPQWPDPVPFLTGSSDYPNFSGSKTTRKVGYGEDDSQLGGSFIQDDNVVFHALAQKSHYWKIETKDFYTGKGWKTSDPRQYEKLNRGNMTHKSFASNEVETDRLRALVEFTGTTRINKLVYPYGLNEVIKDEQIDLLFDPITEAIRSEKDNENFSISSYGFTYDDPSFDTDALRESSEQEPDQTGTYTQLPAELPDRVKTLAEEITAPYTNRYDQAKAIEEYFGSSGFIYQTSNVPIPGEEEDYVDQFLFDTQAGYCDNYSTSMVILLRTLDIPARWVKGFTGGELIETNVGEDSSYNKYEITNRNAHSWVEVLFPYIGWVPFEPTQGFSNLTDFHTESSSEDEVDIDPETSQVEQEIMDEDITTEEEQTETLEEEQESEEAESNDGFQLKNWHIASILAAILLLAYVIYKQRYKLKTIFIAYLFKRNNDKSSFEKAYHHLLHILTVKGLPKGRDETLRKYAKRIDRRFDSNKMSLLTSYYEQIIYNDVVDIKDKDLFTLWNKLIKNIE